ncbi:MAG: MarR family EPS-associated transcriptional regulator [Rhodobacteraceae bacterium]|jgi:EPS-associated MarR family transcriptional regulator|nr:MarR family EPS-associated transcriptional regulator [Paracoccaceae bacterium]
MTQSGENIRFRVMRLLQDNPKMSQRQLSQELGVSLGAVNYCLRALVDKGEVKIRNFRAAGNKMRYAYILTPRGVAQKAAITRHFLARKIAEYEALKAEIAALEQDIQATPADGATGDRG